MASENGEQHTELGAIDKTAAPAAGAAGGSSTEEPDTKAEEQEEEEPTDGQEPSSAGAAAAVSCDKPAPASPYGGLQPSMAATAAAGIIMVLAFVLLVLSRLPQITTATTSYLLSRFTSNTPVVLVPAATAATVGSYPLRLLRRRRLQQEPDPAPPPAALAVRPTTPPLQEKGITVATVTPYGCACGFTPIVRRRLGGGRRALAGAVGGWGMVVVASRHAAERAARATALEMGAYGR